eukprot:gene9735-6822_t
MMRGSNGTRHRRQVSKGGSPIRYCLGDLSLCRNYPKRSTGDIWICMRELIDYISNRHCREYVEGFYLCMKDINEEDSCTQDLPDWSTTVRHCMRAKHPSTISDECKSTSFYRNCRNDLEENESELFYFSLSHFRLHDRQKCLVPLSSVCLWSNSSCRFDLCKQIIYTYK